MVWTRPRMRTRPELRRWTGVGARRPFHHSGPKVQHSGFVQRVTRTYSQAVITLTSPNIPPPCFKYQYLTNRTSTLGSQSPSPVHILVCHPAPTPSSLRSYMLIPTSTNHSPLLRMQHGHWNLSPPSSNGNENSQRTT